MLVEYLKDKGFELSIDGDALLVKSRSHLTNEQSNYLKLHKNEIISELKACNDDRKFRFSYRYEMENGDRGTLTTESPPEKARREIQAKFFMKLVSFDLVN